MKRTENMPSWVYWGLYGVNTRKSAKGFVSASSSAAVLLAVFMNLAINMTAGLIAGGVLCAVSAWYWFALRWVDKHGHWDEPSA